MEIDRTVPPLLQEGARMVGIITAFTIALKAAVDAHPRAAELHDCIPGIRQAARADLGKFDGQPGFDGIEAAIGDFEQMLSGSARPHGRRVEAPEVPMPLDVAAGRMVGTAQALLVALTITVESNPRAAKLRGRLDEIREVAIVTVIGSDVEENVFDGIDYVMDELDDMLPPASA